RVELRSALPVQPEHALQVTAKPNQPAALPVFDDPAAAEAPSAPGVRGVRGGVIPELGPAGRVNLLNLEPAAAAEVVREFAVEQGLQPYRAAQVLPRLWERPAASFDELSDLPKAFRTALAERFEMPRLECTAR